tara:strand:+ start:190 stop:324 length:135 start_codon:yes stop_codon:yes gene_type:complete
MMMAKIIPRKIDAAALPIYIDKTTNKEKIKYSTRAYLIKLIKNT